MKKDTSIHQPGKPLTFWACAGLLTVLLVSIITRDITRPFYGLHSWAQASGDWAARSHVKYGLGYTKGVSTWAVGQPPTENPLRYYDHPQLGNLIKAGVMAVLGVNEWSPRIMGVLLSAACLLVFLKIMRALTNDKTALMAGLIYTIFPLSGYFGLGGFTTLFGFSAIWCYLVLTGSLEKGPKPSAIHKFGLAASLFMGLQFGWPGFFYAMTIGIHYVGRCALLRQMPDKKLLAILIVAPFASLLVNFTVMAAGYGWTLQKIVELYKWRSSKGEMQEFLWSAWFAKFWYFAETNFTLPVLITAILYLTVGQLFILTQTREEKDQQGISGLFPQFWLFFLTPVFQLFVLKGCLWKHQTWEMPFGPFIAIAAALGIMLLGDILGKISHRLSLAGRVCLITVCLIFCIIGTNYYYDIRWQSPAKIEMFKMLNKKIPPDKALLSFEDFIVDQHSSKGGFYRPEIAWYLDREITPARTADDIQRLAGTGRYPYYLIPQADQLMPLINLLTRLYKYQYVAGDPGAETKDGNFLRAGVIPYLIFDLNSKIIN